jgi:hypothetical protein
MRIRATIPAEPQTAFAFAFVLALAFLSVIPEGNLLLPAPTPSPASGHDQ